MYQYDCDRPIDENLLCYIAYHGDSYESVKLYLDIVNLIFKEDIERDYRGKLKNYDSTLFQFYMIWDYIARWRKDYIEDLKEDYKDSLMLKGVKRYSDAIRICNPSEYCEELSAKTMLS